MHLRSPSVDRGTQAFAWAVVFFLVVWLGLLAIGIGHGTGLPLALALGFFAFVVIRVRGGHRR